MNEKIDNESILFKEIELIQRIIDRMARNSFLIKGWTLTLVVATLLLKGSENMVLIAFIPLIVFWFLDAYFLHQERLFRELYKWVVENRLKTTDYMFDMNTMRFKKNVDKIPRVMISTTLFSFYFTIFILICLYSIVLLLNQGT